MSGNRCSRAGWAICLLEKYISEDATMMASAPNLVVRLMALPLRVIKIFDRVTQLRGALAQLMDGLRQIVAR
jgi:hypothetical protein